MSRPRFLADNDLDDAIVLGVCRHEPLAEFTRLRDIGLAAARDVEVLERAAIDKRIVVSHDVNTLRAAAQARLAKGQPMNGLLLVHQRQAVWPIIENLVLIWAAREAEE
jgi:predicted nuclease of predicted toxin-antitoxin system